MLIMFLLLDSFVKEELISMEMDNFGEQVDIDVRMHTSEFLHKDHSGEHESVEDTSKQYSSLR